jgi:hypoxanthine-guanine phosphoribosyltransferase
MPGSFQFYDDMFESGFMTDDKITITPLFKTVEQLENSKKELERKHILVIKDVYDTGESWEKVHGIIEPLATASVQTIVVLHKRNPH